MFQGFVEWLALVDYTVALPLACVAGHAPAILTSDGER